MTDKQKSAAKTSAKLGEAVEVAEGGLVQRPDGSQHAVTGGSYVLDAPGAFVVDGSEYQVK